MNKKTIPLTTLMLLTLILLTGCLPVANGRSHGNRETISNETGKDVYTYELPANASSLTLDIDVRSSQGRFSWRATNPHGEPVLEAQLEGSDTFSKRTEFELLPGQWTLEMAMEQAAGSYDIEWRSR